MQPHLSRCWLNPNIENFDEFQETVSEVCRIYLSIDEFAQEGAHVYSTDEKMGIHAREHANPKQNMQPGQVERVDPEYIRHGTSGIIASRNVATGEITAPLVQPERKEPDFLLHIERVVSLNPNDRHIFITDNLNTHMSESLVKFVAELEGIEELSLGIKGKCGILKNMNSRCAFLNRQKPSSGFCVHAKTLLLAEPD